MRRRTFLTAGAAAAAALATPALSAAQATRSFRDFGALADGGDDGAAIRSALSSGESIVNPRFEVYTLDGPVALRDTPIYLRGGILQFAGSDGGLHAENADAYLFDIDDVEVIALRDLPGAAVSLAVVAPGRVAYDMMRHERTCRIGGGTVMGGVARDRGSWGTGLHLSDVSGAEVGAVLVRGRTGDAGDADRYWREGSVGIRLDAPNGGSPVTSQIDAAHVRQMETAISAMGEMEGLEIVGGHCVTCRSGIVVDWLQGNGGTNPGLFLRGVHVNASERCIALRGISEAFVTGNELYRFPHAPAGDGGWVGVDCDRIDRSILSQNLLNGFNRRDGMETPGIPIRLAHTKRTLVADNRGYNVDAPVVAAGDANAGVTLRGNVWEGLGDVAPRDAPGVVVAD